jgi:hypothetical protein
MMMIVRPATKLHWLVGLLTRADALAAKYVEATLRAHRRRMDTRHAIATGAATRGELTAHVIDLQAELREISDVPDLGCQNSNSRHRAELEQEIALCLERQDPGLVTELVQAQTESIGRATSVPSLAAWS